MLSLRLTSPGMLGRRLQRTALLIEHDGVGVFGCGVYEDEDCAEEDHNEAKENCKRGDGTAPGRRDLYSAH